MTRRLEVRVADDHSTLVLSGDDTGARAVLAASSIAPVRTGAGVGVRAADAGRLLDADGLNDAGLRWRPEAERWAHNRAMAWANQPILRDRVRDVVEAGAPSARRALNEVPDIAKLDDHQAVNVAAMTLNECYGLCLFDEQGAGKTVSVVYAWDVLAERRAADLLVVVAPKSMATEWAHDIERFRPTLYRVVVVDGPRREKRRALARRADVVVLGFDALITLEHELRSLAARRRTVLVVDESFTVKNPDALRTAATRRTREWVDRCWVLCGTPAPNAPHDVRAQVDLADLGVAFAGVSLPDERAAASTAVRDVLENRAVYLRSLKREALPDLPDKRFDIVHVKLAPRQRQLYEALRGELVEALEGIDEEEFRRHRASFIARRTAMLQVCSNPIGVDASHDEEPVKLAAVRSIVSQRVAVGEKVVVWSFYRASLAALVGELAIFGAVRYDGTVASVEDRRRAVRSFQEDPDVQVFVGNPAAAGAGLTLTASRCAVYESMSNQAAHYLQSLDRVHRRGQDRDVHYVVLLAEDTIEQAAFDRLRHKQRDAQQLLGDPVEEPLTRTRMLAELLGTGHVVGARR